MCNRRKRYEQEERSTHETMLFILEKIAERLEEIEDLIELYACPCALKELEEEEEEEAEEETGCECEEDEEEELDEDECEECGNCISE